MGLVSGASLCQLTTTTERNHFLSWKSEKRKQFGNNVDDVFANILSRQLGVRG